MNTQAALAQQLGSLQNAIADILLSSPEPIKEFDLIQQLQQPPYQLLSTNALRGELQLFRTHFLIFHCLYRLQDLWRSEQSFELAIDPLQIKLHSYQVVMPGLTKEDPLKSYYSNWANMINTTEADVDDLLNAFWRGFVGEVVTSEDLTQAFAAMELEQLPATETLLRSHYRRLVHVHHPDKGGEVTRMQIIQHAYQLLKNHLANSGR